MTHNVSKREPHKAKGLSRNERRFNDGPCPDYRKPKKARQAQPQPRREAYQVEVNQWGRLA